MQIYAEAESNANELVQIALPRREQYMWPQAKYTQKLRGMEINLFKFHSRSATVYVAAGQIYAEAESRTNLFNKSRRDRDWKERNPLNKGCRGFRGDSLSKKDIWGIAPLPRREQYMWPQAKYTQKPRAEQIYMTVMSEKNLFDGNSLDFDFHTHRKSGHLIAGPRRLFGSEKFRINSIHRTEIRDIVEQNRCLHDI